VRKTIGVLGGLGPESSAEFYKNLILELQKRNLVNKNEDYPHILINSIPAPELVNHDDLSMYRAGVKVLETAGADFIVIICNTAYLFFEELQKEIEIPIVDLRHEIKKFFMDKPFKGLLALGSSKIVSSDLFRMKGLETLDMDEVDRKKLDTIILGYNSGLEVLKQKEDLLEIIERYGPPRKRRKIL